MSALAHMDAPMDEAGRQQPFDVPVEQALIGAVLRENAAHIQAATLVQGEDFYDPLHQRIWGRVGDLCGADMVVTALTLHAAMKNDTGLIELGGREYLESLRDAAPAMAPVRDYARILHDLAIRRRSLVAITDAVEMLYSPEIPVLQALAPLVTIADHTANELENRAGSSEAGDAAYALIKEIEAGDGSHSAGVPTGLTRLDDLIGGLMPENLIIVAGRPGMGKSSQGTNMARAAALAGFQVEYFSLEMSKRELSARMVCDMDFCRRRDATVVPIHYSRLLKRRVSGGEFERAVFAAGELKAMPIFIHDRDGLTMAEIAALARARASHAGDKPGVVIVDHLQIVRPSDRYRGSRVSELTEMTGQAKALAKAIKWPVVLLSQLSREIEKRPEKDRMPMLSDLRESGSIEQDADVVLAMFRQSYYVKGRQPAAGADGADHAKWLVEYEPLKNRLDLGVIKNRHGSCETVRCFVDIAASAIRDSDPFNGVAVEIEEGLFG